MSGRGYFAVSRAIFDHPLFRSRPQWHRAWEWLIARAAWCAKTERLSFGVLKLERGQLAVTVRTLAEEWEWPKSSVDYFLRRLEEEGMVVRARSRTKSRTNFGTKNSHPATLLTICNYDKFQSPSTSAAEGLGQKVGQKVGQLSQQVFEFPAEPAPNHLNHSNHKEREEGNSTGAERGDRKRGRGTKPAHGARSPDGNTIWFDYETPEWNAYAQDHRDVRAIELMPESRIGGRGNWFWYWGEAKRPQRRRTKPWIKATRSAKLVLAPQLGEPTTNSSEDVVPLASTAGA